MKKEHDDLIHLFRTQLEDAELPVSDSLWDRLEQNIPATISRRRIFFTRISTAASVLLILGVASAAFWFLSPKDEIAAAFTEIAVNIQPEGEINTDHVVQEEFPPIHAQSQSFNPSSVPQNPLNRVLVMPDEDSVSVSISMSFSFTTKKRNNNPYQEQTAYITDHNKELSNEPSETEQSPTYTGYTKKNNGWSVSFFISANPPRGSVSHTGLYMFTERNNALSVANTGSNSSVSRDDFDTEQAYNNFMRIAGLPSEKQTRVRHHIPVSAGINIRKQLNERISLESGLVYSYASSELSGGDDKDYYSQQQKLHYLGIPLKANVNLYSQKKMDIYAAAGGMIEKSVTGKIDTDYFDNGQLAYSSSSKINPKEFQLSATLSAGIKYALNEKISVFAEPGISYYFDNDSPITTIRSERPLNFNLLCGLNVTF